MGKRNAIVIGAGIGGLAVAGALGRHGWHVDLFERRPEVSAVGAGLLLAANGVRAVRALGLGGQLAGFASPVTTAGFRTPSGSWLGRMDPERLAARLGDRMVAVPRPALHRMLADALGPRVTVHTGVTVDSPPEGELVVAADGIASVVRAALAPRVLITDVGQVAWRALVPAAVVDTEVPFAETLGDGLRFGSAPLGRAGVYWYATAPAGLIAGSPAEQLGQLRLLLGDWHRPVPQLLAATDPARLLIHPIAQLASVPTMAHGRTALLGDAAHAMTPNLGQGACQALEDAVTLAALVTDGADVPAALTRYDALRRPRTAAVRAQADRLGSLVQARGPLARRLRDLLLAAIPDRITEAGAVQLADWRPPVTS
ncbi:monooxygenase [Longispora fulva]|uniref:2-polyprenyl-6-methoxyphenol hydroxylase-like FAD-dependent oxidoreductase n=1 Tax=Longispora fulva TaxID=619741 RepID=A0A8J7G5B9_9ACTN|nr:FAD-dependent monooxygenase [Longispora fulva]MBG6133953.1 2-polyprenyl-6-methoxyphenol hydroxylase-like FAD-dependent oxidoreductase [Longispora fulva]GIG63487.1 monooxygenase [Longispora fulva]